MTKEQGTDKRLYCPTCGGPLEKPQEGWIEKWGEKPGEKGDRFIGRLQGMGQHVRYPCLLCWRNVECEEG